MIAWLFIAMAIFCVGLWLFATAITAIHLMVIGALIFVLGWLV